MDITIKEYTDWNNGKNFTEKPIQINRDTYRITQIRNYIHTERRRKEAIQTKQGLCGTITYTIGKWKMRQLESPIQELQEAAENNDMQPIWKYQSRLRMNNQAAIKK